MFFFRYLLSNNFYIKYLILTFFLLFVFKNKQITYCNGGYSSYVNIDDKSSKTKGDGVINNSHIFIKIITHLFKITNFNSITINNFT